MNNNDTTHGKITNLDEFKEAFSANIVLPLVGCHESDCDKRGDEQRYTCVVHNGDHQKSLCINITKKTVYCHSCHFTGSFLDLFFEVNGFDPKEDFREGVQAAADAIGFPLRFSGATKTDMPDTTKAEKGPRTPQQVLEKSMPLLEHAYLNDKCVDICKGLYLSQNKFEYDNDYKPQSIGVPMSAANHELKTMQFIPIRGYKTYLEGNKAMRGEIFVIDEAEIKDGDTVFLAEGLATALAIWMAYNKSSLVASFGSSGNLINAVKELKAEFPNIKLRICLDYNTAAFSQAYKLQDLPNCSFCWPSFEGLPYQKADPTEKDPADFNDIVSKCGRDVSIVKSQLAVTHDYAAMAKELTVLNSMKQGKVQAAAKASDAPIVSRDPGVNRINEKTVDSFEASIAEECIKYFIQPYENLVVDGTDNLLCADNFTGLDYDTVDAIIKTHESGKPVTISEIVLNAPDDKREAIYGRLKKISTLPIITPEQLKDRASVLAQLKSRRELTALLNDCKDRTEPMDITAERIRNGIDDIQAKSSIPMAQDFYLCSIFEEIENPKSKPIETGFSSFDLLLGGGLKKAEIGILSGGAGAGKSAFALQLTDQIAAKEQAHVVYISMEINRTKLTQRSLKRQAYKDCSESNITTDLMRQVLPQYEKFCSNITIIKGHPGMRLSEIRGLVLSIMHRVQREVFLIIDPYQRLSTGNEKIDFNNETLKTGILITDIKDMADRLSIPILALSDTVKQHKDNISGEGAARGSYMNDHIADYTMMLRTSRDPWQALYGVKDPAKESEGSQQKNGKNKAQSIDIDDPFLERVKKFLDSANVTNGFYSLKRDYDKYAALVTPKYRDGGIFNPFFLYRPYAHSFLEIKLWDDVFGAKVKK